MAFCPIILTRSGFNHPVIANNCC